MSSPAGEPPPLPYYVKAGDHRLAFPSSATHDYLLPFTMLAGVGLVVLGYVSGAIEPFGAALLTLFPALGVSFGLGLLFSHLKRGVVVTSTGIRLTGPFAPAIGKPEAIVMEGAVGRPQRMVVGDVYRMDPEVAAFDVDATPLSWSHEVVTWVGQRTAELLEVPFVDQRDPDWKRFLEDPVFREDVQFDVAQEDNQLEFHAQHGCGKTEPAEHQVDLGGSRSVLSSGFFTDSVLELDRHRLRLGEFEIPLAEVRRVGVFYRKVRTKNSTSWYGALRVLTALRDEELVELGVGSSGGPTAETLNWAAAQIREAAQGARPDELGDTRDVPAALRRLQEEPS